MKKELNQDSFVHYEEQRQKLLEQLREWGALVEKSTVLAEMKGDERYPEMCRDTFLPAFVNTHKGDQAKEYQILLAACQIQVRHLGKVSGKAEHAPVLMSLLPVTNPEDSVFEEYRPAVERLIRKYQPCGIRRWLGLYNRKYLMHAMTADLQQLFTRIINDTARMFHEDYHYEWHPLSIDSWMDELWDCYIAPTRRGRCSRAMLRADGSTSSASTAVEAVREEFFLDYWEDARQYATKLSETVKEHLKDAQRLLHEMKKLAPAD